MSEQSVSNLRVDELSLHIELLAKSPTHIDGWGTIADYEWEFYSRSNQWTFAVSLDRIIHPSRWEESEVSPHNFFLIQQTQGGARAYWASELPLSKAVEIIRWCSKQFIEHIENKYHTRTL